MKTKPKYQSKFSRQRQKGEPVETLLMKDGTRRGAYGIRKEGRSYQYLTSAGWIDSHEVKRVMAYDPEDADGVQLMGGMEVPTSQEPSLSANAASTPAPAVTAELQFDGQLDFLDDATTAEAAASDTPPTVDDAASQLPKPYMAYVISHPDGVDSCFTDLRGNLLLPKEVAGFKRVNDYIKHLVDTHSTGKVLFDHSIAA